MAEVVVIGAGMGGLATAARLATLGHQVTVCEQSKTHGGMVGVHQRDSFSFDTGPGHLLLPAVYRDLFLKTGAPLDKQVELTEMEPAVRHLLPGGEVLDLPNATRGGVAEALDGALGSGAAERWHALLDQAGDVWAATRRPLLEEPASDADLSRTPGLPNSLRERVKPGSDSLQGLAKRKLRDPGLVALLEEYALRFGFDPRTAPASLLVLPYMEQTFGSWYVSGGTRALANALFARCQQRRVAFLTGTTIAAVTLHEGRASGVRLADGRHIRADLVVADTQGERLAVEGWRRPTALPARGAQAGLPAPGRFSVFLALRGQDAAGALPRRTVVHAPSRHAELHALFPGVGPGKLCEKPTVQVLRPNDPALCPAEHQTVTLTVTVPSHGRGDGRFDYSAHGTAERYADRLLEYLDSRGLKLREQLLWRDVRTPFDLERDTAGQGGSIPGPALAGQRGAFLRPANDLDLPGLYLVGGNAHPGGGLAHAGMSAAITAQLIGSP